MKLSELRSLIHELIRGEVEETSTSGNAGAYNTPLLFQKTKSNEKIIV